MRALNGVAGAYVDVVRMELVVDRDRSKVEIDRIIEAVRSAGFQADRE